MRATKFAYSVLALGLGVGIAAACGDSGSPTVVAPTTPAEEEEVGTTTAPPERVVEPGVTPPTEPPRQDEEEPVEPDCVKKMDLVDGSVPDAAIGASASTGLCMACTRSKCAAQLAKCNAKCECNVAVVELFECMSEPGAQVQSCAGGLLGGGSEAQMLGICVYEGCQEECGLRNLIGGADAGLTRG